MITGVIWLAWPMAIWPLFPNKGASLGGRQRKWGRLWVPVHPLVGSAVGRGPRKDVKWLNLEVQWGQIEALSLSLGNDLGVERENRRATKPSFSSSSSIGRYLQAPSQAFCFSVSLERGWQRCWSQLIPAGESRVFSVRNFASQLTSPWYLKLAIMGGFTLWMVANATNSRLLLPTPYQSQLSNVPSTH